MKFRSISTFISTNKFHDNRRANRADAPLPIIPTACLVSVICHMGTSRLFVCSTIFSTA